MATGRRARSAPSAPATNVVAESSEGVHDRGATPTGTAQQRGEFADGLAAACPCVQRLVGRSTSLEFDDDAGKPGIIARSESLLDGDDRRSERQATAKGDAEQRRSWPPR